MKLTSSRFAAAIGMNPHCSRQRLFRQLTGVETVGFVAAMAWGLDHEKDAVSAAECALGYLFDNTGRDQEHFTLTDPKNGFEFGTTPDGVRERLHLHRLSPKRVGLEVKCPQKMWDNPPAYYVPQLIGQAKIARLEEIYFSAWTPEDLKIWHFQYSEKMWEWLLPLLEGFMDNWKAGIEPPRQKKPQIPDEFVDMEELSHDC